MKMQITDGRITPAMMTPAHKGDAGIDLRASITKNVSVPMGTSEKFGTGVKMAIEPGWVALIFPKSGKGSKGMHLANVVGVIDSGYRGEIIATIKNNASNIKPMIIEPLDKIFQMIIIPHYVWENMQFVSSLDETERGDQGFGSTDHFDGTQMDQSSFNRVIDVTNMS